MFGLSAGFSIVVTVFLMIAAIMAIFVPFWVFRIRNEAIDTNRRLDALITVQKGVQKDLQDLLTDEA